MQELIYNNWWKEFQFCLRANERIAKKKFPDLATPKYVKITK